MVTRLKGQPLGQLTFLQWLSLALNKLTDLEGLGCPALESLNLTGQFLVVESYYCWRVLVM